MALAAPASTVTQAPTTPTSSATAPTTYTPPPHASFPPFYTLQPNASTRASQLASWSALLLSACAASHSFTLTPSSPLFANPALNRRLVPADARTLFTWMATRGEVEWVVPESGPGARKGGAAPDDLDVQVYVYWRGAGAWAAELARWVEETGQRGVVLTVYELLEGDATAGCAWRGMPAGMFRRVVGVLVKEGRAVVFGEGDGVGVKIL